MKKDYSEYQHSEQEIYDKLRDSNEYVYFDFFENKINFSPADSTMKISVYGNNEYVTMKNKMESLSKLEIEKGIYENEIVLPDEQKRIDEKLKLQYDQNKMAQVKFSRKFDIDFERRDALFRYLSDLDENGYKGPVENIFSGTNIKMNIGQGILDFIYADFTTPYKKVTGAMSAIETLGLGPEENRIFRNEKVYNLNQKDVQLYYDYLDSRPYFIEIAYSSLYTSICPPVFIKEQLPVEGVQWYYNYLFNLQQEYKELIEFCFDENFYFEVFKDRHAIERYSFYKEIHKQSHSLIRNEFFNVVSFTPDGEIMPFGKPAKKIVNQIQRNYIPTEEHKNFQKKYNLDSHTIENFVCTPYFANVFYKFRNVKEILKLEFTKLIEQNIRFRKCKRCGRYFIMKGNYNTNYCNRIADGETRNCQELMALEKYKNKMADKPAIKIYNKYYKRYSARVKAHTILERDFKKWKYEAMTKRDECSDGKLSERKYIEWMESCFPNKKRKH